MEITFDAVELFWQENCRPTKVRRLRNHNFFLIFSIEIYLAGAAFFGFIVAYMIKPAVSPTDKQTVFNQEIVQILSLNQNKFA